MAQARDEAGNIWETDANGNAVRIVRPAGNPQGGVFTLPPDQQQVASGAREDERIAIARAAASRADATAQAAERARIQQQANERVRIEADLATKGLMIGPDGQIVPRPDGAIGAGREATVTAKVREDAITAYADSQALLRAAMKLREQYATGPGTTGGLSGWQDYLPTSANKSFDDTSFQQRGRVKRAMAFTGGEGNTVGEINLNYGPYLPEASDFDARIGNKIGALETLANDSKARAIQILGGAPDINGRITPVNPQAQPLEQRDPLHDNYATSQDNRQAAAFGADTKLEPIPPAMQAEYEAFMGQWTARPDPEAYVRFRQDLDRKYGYAETADNLAEYRRFGEDSANRLERGGATINTRIPGAKQPLSGIDQLRNNVVSNPVGAGLAGFADAVGMGGVSALAPEQMAALGEKHNIAMPLGQIAGAIAATEGIGMAGRASLGKMFPKLMQQGAAAKASRILATDLGYGTVTGTNQGMDPRMAALASGVGSLAGQGLGKAAGTAIGGINVNPQAAALLSRGYNLTTGQRMGGFAKSTEDAMTSIPGVGDLVNARRLEGLRTFNSDLLNEAGRPIGATIANTGERGINDLLGAAGNAYDSATAGVRVSIDPQFATDMRGVTGAVGKLPPDYAALADKIGENRIGPIMNAGELTGDAYQQAMRGLKASRASAGKAAPGFEQEYRDALTMGMDALTGQMKRGGGASVVKGLGNADQAYRAAKSLLKAMQAAKNGTGSGEVQIFTPAQANTAMTQAANKYGGGRQFGDMIDTAQSVLPSKLPDSGTARRMMQNFGIGGAGIGAGGSYAGVTDDYSTPAKALGILGFLAAGGTKGGQKAINKLLFDRSSKDKAIGSAINKQKGLAGAAAVPLFLESGQ